MDGKPVKRVQMQPMSNAASLFLVVVKQRGKVGVQLICQVHGIL